jgi:hypothetical protein
LTLLDTFTDIAGRAGFTLPETLAAWYRDGLTGSDDARAMAAVHDFEWISPDASQQVIDEWLNPAAQHGNRFFPFAESGAGDANCLVKLADGQEGAGLVWHDAHTSSIEHASFADFVVAAHLRSYADLSHLATPDADLSAFIGASVAAMTPSLPTAHADALLAPTKEGVSRLPFKSGPKARPEMVPALLAQDAAESQAAAFALAEPIEFEVVASWEIEA